MIDISEANDLTHRKYTGGGRKIRDTQRPPVESGEERQPQKKAELRRPVDFRPSVSLFGRQGGSCRRFPFKEMALANMGNGE